MAGLGAVSPISSYGGRGGFYEAPLTKGLMSTMFLGTCCLHMATYKHLQLAIKQYLHRPAYLPLAASQVTEYCVHRLVFFDLKDVLCGLLLLYYFKMFERRYGSANYASYLFANGVVSYGLHYAVIQSLSYFQINSGGFPTGPYSLLYSIFVPYFLDVPRVAHITVFGIPICVKTYTYLIGLQMVTTSRETMLAAFCGLVSAVLYRNNVLKIKSFLRIPTFVSKASEATFGWAMKSKPPQDLDVPIPATLELQRSQQLDEMEREIFREQQHLHNNLPGGWLFAGRQNQGNMANDQNQQNALRQANNMEQPSEDNIQRLVEMGFERNHVSTALRQAGNDVSQATNILLQRS